LEWVRGGGTGYLPFGVLPLPLSCLMVSQGRGFCTAGGKARRSPLSPMLFLLAMEPLHILFRNTQEWGLLGKLSSSCDIFRVSLYADDAAILIRPSGQGWKVTNCILRLFAEASGFTTNLAKTEFFPIHCQEVSLDFLNEANCIISSFPCNYLGLPLHVKKPTISMMETLIQKNWE
jgi:hypothetical protein